VYSYVQLRTHIDHTKVARVLSNLDGPGGVVIGYVYWSLYDD